MTIEQRDKYAYELMVKNNPEEAVKQLLLKDKKINDLQQKIDKTLEHIERKWKKDSYYEDVDNCLQFMTVNEFDHEDLLKILKGE